MSDEIKEIINSLKFVIDNPTLEDEVGDEQVAIINYTELNAEESKQLLDYITNLQEELEITNKKWEQDKMFCENRLIEILELKEENRQTKLLKDKYQLEKEVYKSRIDKAVDYITTEQLYTNYQWGKSQYAKILKDLLNILNGDEDE